MIEEDIFRGIGVEVLLPVDRELGELADRKRAAFLKVAETLTRIGVPELGEESGKPVLRQMCYILHKQGRYVIAHANELRWLDGEPVVVSDKDVAVRNRVADLLEAWGLVDLLLDDDEELDPCAPLSQMKIIAYRDKPNWTLCSEYAIGRPRAVIGGHSVRAQELAHV